jgi:hypothetical protein
MEGIVRAYSCVVSTLQERLTKCSYGNNKRNLKGIAAEYSVVGIAKHR